MDPKSISHPLDPRVFIVISLTFSALISLQLIFLDAFIGELQARKDRNGE